MFVAKPDVSQVNAPLATKMEIRDAKGEGEVEVENQTRM
jgi:hypothetical protein